MTTALLHLDRLRQPTTFRGRLIAGVSALALFGLVVYLAVRSLPQLTDTDPWLVLILVLVTTPAIAVVNALEFRLIGRLVNTDYSFMESAKVTLLGTIANFLPAPGSFMVRTGSMSKRGIDLRSATSSNLVATALWVGTTAVVAGVAFLAAGDVATGVGCLVPGTIIFVASSARILRLSSVRVAGSLALMETAKVVVSAVRMWVAFRALGVSIGAQDAVIIGTAQLLATIVGIAPAGLGIRELLGAALAAAVGIDPAVTIAATAVDRAASQVGFILIGAIFLAAGRITSADLLARLRLRRSAPSRATETTRDLHRPGDAE